MAAPIKEVKSETSPTPLYSMDELMILARMERFMNGKPFHYLDIDTSIPQADKLKRKAIVEKLSSIVLGIRYKVAEKSALFDYQDIHFDEPDHTWLQELHPGVNVNGWRVTMVLMDPVKYGQGMDYPEEQVLGTISRRSAKS